METNILKSLRQKNNYTEDFVAHILNMSQSAYSRLELGQTALSLPRAQQLSALYNVDLNIIAGENFNEKE